ncbi:MAG: phosphatase [Bacteroidetes bacterium]|nr:phosphatase [Bacteroidota bacterium]
MRIAVLDLGTNTFHLLIVDVHADHSCQVVFKTRAVVKLGKDGIGKNVIAEAPFNRGIKVLAHFKKQVEKHSVTKVFAFATSAIRSSTNGKEFVRKAYDETGIKIKVIAGDEEAKLIYYGVRQCVKTGEEPALIMDIGGGSTEFIIANEKQIFWKQSFNIGVSRLLEQFNPSDPILPTEMVIVKKYLDDVLQPLIKAIQKYPVKQLIGSSGSFDTLAEMIGHRFYHRNIIKGKTSYEFSLKEYDELHRWLMKSTTKMRLKTKGLVRMRVDMIVLSSICTQFVLEKSGIKKMMLSKYALKEGALTDIIERQF